MELPFGRTFLSAISFRDLLAFAAIFLTVQWIVSRLRGSHVTSAYRHLPLPPSPPGLPLVGNMFSLRTDMRHLLEKWTQELGGIFTIRLGPTMNMVVLNDLEAFQEAFVQKGDRFAGRPVHPSLTFIGTTESFLWETYPRWKTTRRLGVEALRFVGMGKSSMENRVMAECEVLVDHLRKHVGIPFSHACAVSNVVANITCSIVLGRRYEHEDPVFRTFVHNLNTMNDNVSFTSMANAFPILYRTPLYKNFRVPLLDIANFVKQHVNDHRREAETVTEVRDIIDFLRQSLARRRERGLSDHVTKDREWRGIFDIFVAGISTTSDTLFWALLLLAKYPRIMTECQKEIDDVIGSGKTPTESDKERLPFVCATIQEILRYRPVVPMSLARENDEETELCGYRIPKGSTIIMNVCALHMNPKYWDEPEKFNPRRFLSEDGKTVLNPPALATFGMGLRSCMGERLGRLSTFLILTNILQKFSFRLADESKLTGLDGIFSVTWTPHRYDLVVEERQID